MATERFENVFRDYDGWVNYSTHIWGAKVEVIAYFLILKNVF